MITGAAGSIGSELARQVALHTPVSLVLVDQAETPLFYLQQELLGEHPSLDLVTIVQDVVDPEAVAQLFDRYQPDRVFHAAAYKHVPMMETNPEQAIRNNVLGTRVVAEAAGRYGCAKFVLVSTDKAVEPANIMGATKRLAELVILEMQAKHRRTAFGAVRFGNVLGSSGSVLPIFRRQLARSRPLTVTHPDVSRYFMTIPEAVQLILQASLLEEFRGHIAMLEMGEPIRILDLAKNFLRLSGMPPKVGETIVFTGLRPGEKLHEELAAPGEEAIETRVPKVRLLRTCSHGKMQILPLVERWEAAFANGRRAESVAELRSLFTGLEAQEPEPEAEVAAVSTAKTLPGA
jgi:FlaA1/EpsC-like NDP-sugar epimerase